MIATIVQTMMMLMLQVLMMAMMMHMMMHMIADNGGACDDHFGHDEDGDRDHDGICEGDEGDRRFNDHGG